MTKLTYVDAVNFAINALPEDTPQDIVDKLEALKTQLNKRHSSGSRKPTKRQTDNISIKQQMLNFLEEDKERYTATEIGSGVGISCQRAGALLSQMQKAGLVIREEDGKKVYYRVA